MSTNEKLFEPEGRPTRLPGETYAQWQARLEAWRRGVVGDEAELSRTLLAPSVGIPPASPRFAPSPTGERLGDFRVTGTADLPAPRITRPAGASPAAPPSSGPSVPAWARPAMGGALPPGLRPPPTAEEEQSSGRRRWVLEVTGFDLAWGTPPDVEGLRWSPERFLYEPTADAQSVPYRGPASRGFYRQAYSNPTLGPGAWGWRWVEARTTRPDPAYPYRVVGRGEASALDLEVNNARLHRRAPDAEGARTIDVGTLPTGRVPLPSPAPAIVRRPRMTDFAWIPQQDLPIGCPYPHAYLPVPRQDYVSGRWLLPDYVPSIPLPPPYDQTPWQCGKSVAQESKKGKGGGGPPPEGYHVPGGMDPLSKDERRESVSAVYEVGLPPPSGTLSSTLVAEMNPYAPFQRLRTRKDVCAIYKKAQETADKFKGKPHHLFLRTQAEILRRLCDPASPVGKGPHGVDDPVAVDWLVRVLEVFEGSLERYLAGDPRWDLERYRSEGEDSAFREEVFRDIVDGKRSGPWWQDLNEKFDAILEAWSNPFVGATRSELQAGAMMSRHISGDLKVALQSQGIGTDADWRALGDTVNASVLAIVGKQGSRSSQDVLKNITGVEGPDELRDSVRADVRAKLEEQLPGEDIRFQGTRTKPMLYDWTPVKELWRTEAER